jgi:undecaprenyl-diphosphatase
MLDYLFHLDEVAVHWVFFRRTAWWNRVMTMLTRVGDGYLWVVCGILVWWLDRDGWSILRMLAIAYAMELSLYKVLKRLFSRPRPFVLFPHVTHVIVPPDEFSFPSGHTAASFAFAAVIGMVYPVLFVPLVMLSAAIGVSRVYLGVHFPSDVIAGAFLGILSGATALFLL